MQHMYKRVLVSMALVVGLSAGCKMQESQEVTNLKEELAKATQDRNNIASENDSLKANIDTLRKENEELKKQIAGK